MVQEVAHLATVNETVIADIEQSPGTTFVALILFSYGSDGQEVAHLATVNETVIADIEQSPGTTFVALKSIQTAEDLIAFANEAAVLILVAGHAVIMKENKAFLFVAAFVINLEQVRASPYAGKAFRAMKRNLHNAKEGFKKMDVRKHYETINTETAAAF